MNHHELRELVAGSAPDDWIDVPGPTQLEVSDSYEAGDLSYTRVNSHYSRAVYYHDIRVGLAWGLPSDLDDPSRPWRPEWATFPDGIVRTIWADVLYNGAVVDRLDVAVVDGGRGYLPVPSHKLDNSTPPKIIGYKTTAWERSFARLVDQIVHDQSEFDRFFNGAGFLVEG